MRISRNIAKVQRTRQMKLASCLFIFYFGCFNLAIGQYKIVGSVNDSNEALGFANVVLSAKNDSSFVGGTTSDIDGAFELKIDLAGSYYLSISMLGFETFESDPFVLDAKNPIYQLGDVVLSAGGIFLDEVEVVGRKPIFEKKIDRTVLNLKNRVATAGASALEVLERSPGVIVDRSSGVLGMLGKEGVNVMINGKLNYMPNEALLAFLEGMDANNISTIELITTPPAEFDAQGNAGFINIVLKNNPDEGLQGNYSISGGVGKGVIGNGSVGLNYRKGKINLFGNYSYTYNTQDQLTSLERNIGEFKTDFIYERDPTRNNQNARIGIDYQLGQKTTFGVLLSGYSTKWDMDALNTISEIDTEKTTILSQVGEVNDWNHLQGNINLSHTFDSGANLSADYDYLYYENSNPTSYDQDFINESGATYVTTDLFTRKNTQFGIQVSKVDYRFPINDELQFSAGGKFIMSEFENDVFASQDKMTLEEFNSESDLTENVIASYAELDYQLSEPISIKAGLRYEHTDSDLFSQTEGQVVDREFGAFFPSAFLSYRMNPDNQFGFSYSRRINRPSFSAMAPFLIFLDPNTNFGGNTSLQPAVANNFQVDYRYKTINFTAQYTQEDSTIVFFQNRFVPALQRQIITPDNLSEQQIFTTSVAFPVKVTSWWDMRLFAAYTWQSSSTIDELGMLTLSQNSFSLNGSQSFHLPNDLRVEVSGFYGTSALNGNVRFKPTGLLNIGIQKKLKNNARITFNINDMFNSLVYIGETDLPKENIFVSRTFDFSQRTFKLTYSTTFGNSKLKANRRRNSSREERQRVN